MRSIFDNVTPLEKTSAECGGALEFLQCPWQSVCVAHCNFFQREAEISLKVFSERMNLRQRRDGLVHGAIPGLFSDLAPKCFIWLYRYQCANRRLTISNKVHCQGRRLSSECTKSDALFGSRCLRKSSSHPHCCVRFEHINNLSTTICIFVKLPKIFRLVQLLSCDFVFSSFPLARMPKKRIREQFQRVQSYFQAWAEVTGVLDVFRLPSFRFFGDWTSQIHQWHTTRFKRHDRTRSCRVCEYSREPCLAFESRSGGTSLGDSETAIQIGSLTG